MRAYVAMNLLASWFVHRFMPETAGRNLEDIELALGAGEYLSDARAAGPISIAKVAS